MAKWFEDETFWEELFPFMFAERKFEVAEDEVSSILHLADLEEGDVLDLACGPGPTRDGAWKEGLPSDRRRPVVVPAGEGHWASPGGERQCRIGYERTCAASCGQRPTISS